MAPSLSSSLSPTVLMDFLPNTERRNRKRPSCLSSPLSLSSLSFCLQAATPFSPPRLLRRSIKRSKKIRGLLTPMTTRLEEPLGERLREPTFVRAGRVRALAWDVAITKRTPSAPKLPLSCRLPPSVCRCVCVSDSRLKSQSTTAVKTGATGWFSLFQIFDPMMMKKKGGGDASTRKQKRLRTCFLGWSLCRESSNLFRRLLAGVTQQ